MTPTTPVRFVLLACAYAAAAACANETPHRGDFADDATTLDASDAGVSDAADRDTATATDVGASDSGVSDSGADDITIANDTTTPDAVGGDTTTPDAVGGDATTPDAMGSDTTTPDATLEDTAPDTPPDDPVTDGPLGEWCVGQPEDFSFFVTSMDALWILSGSDPGDLNGGFGGDFGGITGADEICQTIGAATGFGHKTWRAFLSATDDGTGNAVHAIERIARAPGTTRTACRSPRDCAASWRTIVPTATSAPPTTCRTNAASHSRRWETPTTCRPVRTRTAA